MRFLVLPHKVLVFANVRMTIEILNKFKFTINHHHLILILSQGCLINHSFIVQLLNLYKIYLSKTSFANLLFDFYRHCLQNSLIETVEDLKRGGHVYLIESCTVHVTEQAFSFVFTLIFFSDFAHLVCNGCIGDQILTIIF